MTDKGICYCPSMATSLGAWRKRENGKYNRHTNKQTWKSLIL